MRLFLSGLGILLENKLKEILLQILSDVRDELLDKSEFQLSDTLKGKLESNYTSLTFLNPGKQTKFVIKYVYDVSHSFVIKFYTLPFQDLILHTLSVDELSSSMSYSVSDKVGSVNFYPLNIYGCGYLKLNRGNLAFLIQDYCEFDDYSTASRYVKGLKDNLKNTSKHIAHNGYIIDPSPTNYKIDYHKDNNIAKFYYIDLCFFNDFALRDKSKSITAELISNTYTNDKFKEYYSTMENE